MAELKPCPFCGGEAKLYFGECYEVCCTNCYASISADGMVDAIEAWNTRTQKKEVE